MCGIAGFVGGTNTRSAEELAAQANTMASQMFHRGPDDGGCWVEARSQLGLGFRRLSILDLTDGGHQPMVSHCGRYVIVFNGELYNFRDIRRELEQYDEVFHGTSDTEVLLASISRWGVERTLRKSNGMFAFALWDRQSRYLTLARDRLGEKPLYYGWANDGSFVFASELKAIRAHPAFRAEIDRNSLLLYFRHGCIPAPYSIFEGIAKLRPGCYISFNPNNPTQTLLQQPYWSLENAINFGLENPLALSHVEAADQLEGLLADSIRLRMVADVPVGAFLSGGIDSSAVVALMQSMQGSQVRTFTIGFHEVSYDEARYARLVAGHLGTDHTELFVSSGEAADVIPQLPLAYDEPFADSSQIPTLLVAQLARTRVTVALTGDGGDELFGGYLRYEMYRKMLRFLRVPRSVRHAIAQSLTALSPAQWDAAMVGLGWAIPRRFHRQRMGEGIHGLADVIGTDNGLVLYQRLMSHCQEPTTLVTGSRELSTSLTAPVSRHRLPPILEAMAADTVMYLPDDILTKVDRASMAHSLEARIPLLDPRIVEMAWQLRPSIRTGSRESKPLLRSILERYVPPVLTDRPKMGFGVPIGEWLRSSIRDWAEDLLSEDRLRRDGLLNPSTVRQLWLEHLEGKHDRKSQLWDILMFQAWLNSLSQSHNVAPGNDPGPGPIRGQTR